MNPSPIFPALPFELYEDEGEGEFEQERGRLGGASARPPMRRAPPKRRPPPPRARPRPPMKPRPPPRPRPRPVPLPPSWPPYGAGYVLPVGDGPGTPTPSGAAPPSANADDERWRCVQACFGRAANASSAPAPAPEGAAPAPDAAVAGGDSSAPDSAGAPAPEPAPEELEYGGPYEYEGEYETGGGTEAECQIVDLTAQAERGHRRGTRDPKSVYVLVLHQMACCARRRDPLRNYLRTKAHFVIVPDGRILQLHPISALLFASSGFNSKSVAVEFAGNFPDVRGRWWQGTTYGRDRPTSAQLQAGRCLIRHLIRTMGLRVVLAHRQSSSRRENDPGPEVWSQVGQWAVDTLGLSDGGRGFKINRGNPIPDAWRTWGRSGSTPELEYEFEDEYEGEDEFETSPGLLTLPAAIADPRAAGAGVYTLFKDGQRVYVGRATQLRRRLQQHLLCLTHLRLAVGRLRVKLTPLSGASPAHLSRVESAVIGRFGRASRGGQLANVKSREF